MNNRFFSPMLAKTLPEHFEPKHNEWVAEEKLDGHRIVVSVEDRQADLFGGRLIRAWSRYGIERILPPHLREAIEAQLPSGVYDGELLVPGERSYGTAVIENSGKLEYVVFDAMYLLDKNLTTDGLDFLGGSPTWDERRAFLVEIFKKTHTPFLRLNHAQELRDVAHMEQLAKSVWARDGEGLILKRRSSVYQPGKRPKDWLKIKQLRTAVMTVIAFHEGKMGPNSVVLVRGSDGYETTVKWKNLEILAEIDKAPEKFIGRKLRIEYQERTPDGSYRHPRWDRWEDE